ncbi:class I SAM-dependent methyltransferase [Allohahella sp. A8]|uniref:class I SAM-dependent methyltransferase n=1 Tax=Allohahella sp. A8 TaxID=3141461 RepID=UPI003A80AB60|tara:strand:+ start:67248 stop:68045 length:798 start_codon:yes stop_codon:yes gene_type:complete
MMPSSKAWAKWFDTAAGQSLLAAERATVTACIQRFFGYHQLEVVLSDSADIGAGSLLGHRIVATQRPSGQLDSVLPCQPHLLPIASDSVDLVILHHTLDVSPRPHQVLREASRVLRSGGHVVVVGFNPYSLWGLMRLIARRRKVPWAGRFLSGSRLEDWCSLLDLSARRMEYRLFGTLLGTGSAAAKALAEGRPGLVERLARQLKLPLGGFYVCVSQKQVGSMIPLKTAWRPKIRSSAAVLNMAAYREAAYEDTRYDDEDADHSH